MKRDLLSVWDLSAKEIDWLIKRAIKLKSGIANKHAPLSGKSIGLFFEKPSTRTKVSFEVGIYQLGGQPIYLNPKEMQLDRGESIIDTVNVLSRYLSGLVIRTYLHFTTMVFSLHASIPIINGLSDLHHPCQALADLMTIQEKKDRLKGIRLAYIGDSNNVTNSLIEAAARTGMDMTIACPEGCEPEPDLLNRTRDEVKGEIVVIRSPEEAVTEADVIYTDAWVSMGQEKGSKKKKGRLRDYQINSALLRRAKKDVLVLHCLPAHRGEEITDDVMDGPNSAVFDQAENRLHTTKALLEFLIK
ncbi:ornithine carbamoyltransferase [Thermodesulfovibrionales bacterium]|nr:ornithine carbamoyltransferase [Thermodesulfovibrionales bacterium]